MMSIRYTSQILKREVADIAEQVDKAKFTAQHVSVLKNLEEELEHARIIVNSVVDVMKAASETTARPYLNEYNKSVTRIEKMWRIIMRTLPLKKEPLDLSVAAVSRALTFEEPFLLTEVVE